MIPIQPSDSTTMLQYRLQTIPYPLTANLASGDGLGVTPATLILLISNPLDVPVTFDFITALIPFGQASGDLVSSPAEQFLAAWPSDPAYAISTSRLSPAEEFLVEIAQAGVSGVPLEPHDGFYVQISGIFVNDQPGIVNVMIEEMIAGVSPAGTAILPVNKLPVGFYFDNLTASLSGSPGAQAVSQVANGDSVVLRWDTSVVDLTSTTFQVIFSTNDGQRIEDVSTPGEWPSPPLTSDTVFTVVAHAPQPDNEFVDLFLTTSVSVRNPDLVAGSITIASEGSPAAGALTVYGAMRQQSDNVFLGTTGAPETVFIYENLVVGSGAPPAGFDGVVINRPLAVGAAYETALSGDVVLGSSASSTIGVTGTVHHSSGNVFFGSNDAAETVYIYENLIVGSGAPPASFDGVVINRPLTVGSSYATSLGPVTISGTLTVTGNLTGNGDLSLGNNTFSAGKGYFGAPLVSLTTNFNVSGQNSYIVIGPTNGGSYSKITPLAVSTTTINAQYHNAFMTDPRRAGVSFVHSAVLGPELALSYRGSSRLDRGRSEVQLPDYFDAIADPDSVTIHLTPVDGFDRLCVVTDKGRKVQGSKFTVTSDDPQSARIFDWEVKARRSDRPPLVVERAT